MKKSREEKVTSFSSWLRTVSLGFFAAGFFDPVRNPDDISGLIIFVCMFFSILFLAMSITVLDALEEKPK